MHSGRILYLDRDLGAARGHFAQLEAAGYEVVGCDRWAEAFGLLRAIRFDGLIVSVGTITHALCALLSAARSEQPSCRRFAVSSTEPEAVLKMCGAQVVLTPPLDIEVLIEHVREWRLDEPRSKRGARPRTGV